MLERLLELIRAGGTQRIGDLAQALDTSPQLVQVMLEDLRRRGYLTAVDPACGRACGGCAFACAKPIPRGQVWTLSD
jgi:predicted ArsR family transcriptional regulator